MNRYIDADTAIKDFETWKENPIKDEHDRIWNAAIDACINDVKNHIPSVDVAEVKHGKWIAKSTQDYFFPYTSCSECGKAYPLGPFAYSYCPNCGAKMDGEEI